jgi:hypothetical protein
MIIVLYQHPILAHVHPSGCQLVQHQLHKTNVPSLLLPTPKTTVMLEMISQSDVRLQVQTCFLTHSTINTAKKRCATASSSQSITIDDLDFGDSDDDIQANGIVFLILIKVY